MAPGILYVTMQPKPELAADKFEDWYNNEHGPLRLRLSFCQNGYRYRAADLESSGKGKHEWMAVYDMDDLELLNGEEYKKLRGPPVQTQRETDIRPYLDIDRKSFDLISEAKADGYQPVDRIGGEKAGNFLVSVLFTLKEGHSFEEVNRWFEDEHLVMIKKIPGWRRSRRFKTSPVDPKPVTEYLTLHEWAPENGTGSADYQAIVNTDWSKKIYGQVLDTRVRRIYNHYYTFGPAPRHISSVSNWDSPVNVTRSIAPTSSTAWSSEESYITTPDGAKVQYRIEGSSDPSAPVILCVNSILAHYDIYTAFTQKFLSANPSYRVVRYLSRGRTSSVGSTSPITLDTHTQDAIHLLDALRVPSVALAIGVSLGGATVLNLGLFHPDRVPAFVSCDTNSCAPPSNPKAWADRIATAESDPTNKQVSPTPYGGTEGYAATVGPQGLIVGEALAEATVRRWFVPASYDDPVLASRIADVKDMVRTNSLAGFKAGVKALYEYDLLDRMPSCKSRGHFLVGAGDGGLPDGMRKMAAALGVLEKPVVMLMERVGRAWASQWSKTRGISRWWRGRTK